MPYAPAPLVLSAVAAMNEASPLAVVSIPALLREARRAGIDPISQSVEFGSGTETALLEEYFRLPRPPDPDRPYRAPWSARDSWQKRKYAGGGLQRQRTDQSGRGRVFVQLKKDAAADRPHDEWRITAAAGAELMNSTTATYTQVRIVDLAIWIGREVDTSAISPNVIAALPPAADDLDRLVAWFVNEFGIDKGDLIGTVYSDEIPAEYRAVPFEPAPIDESTAEQLGSLPPAPSVAGTLDDLVAALEHRVREGGFQLAEGLVRRVLTAWLRGDIVILVGQPGTGKTLFASLLGRAMEAELGLDAPLLISVRADFDESEFIGYERLDGNPQLREFATEILQTDTPLEARVVVLEEFNLASIETYMASVLVAAQEQDRLVTLPAGEQRQLPVDTFILATCNSFRDEPETRTRVSSPTKRRSTTITMSNVLGDRFEVDPAGAVLSLAIELVRNEEKRVTARRESSRSAQFDSLRTAATATVSTLDDFSEDVKDSLEAVTGAILNTSTGRSWFTLGLLRDVVMEIVHANRDPAAELAALGQSVADKLVHQVRGAHEDVEELQEAVADLPNADEIQRLIDQMKSGPSDELLPLI